MSIELPRNHIEDWVFDRILKGFLGHANAFFLLVKSKAGALLQMNFGSYAIFLSAPMRLRVIPSTGILYRLTRRSPLILLLRKNSLVHGSVDLQLTDQRTQQSMIMHSRIILVNNKYANQWYLNRLLSIRVIA